MRSTREASAVSDSNNSHTRPIRQVCERAFEQVVPALGGVAVAVKARELRVRGSAEIIQQRLITEDEIAVQSSSG